MGIGPGASFRPHLNYANAITASGMAAGTAAVMLATAGMRWPAAGCIGLAAACDLTDGTVARKTGTAGPFGHGLDTIADAISFGLASGTVAWTLVLHRAGLLGAAVTLAWTAAVCARLARYLTRGHAPHYEGLPCPAAALVLVTVSAAGAGTWAVTAVAAALSAAMVSAVPVPSPAALFAAARKEPRRDPAIEEPGKTWACA